MRLGYPYIYYLFLAMRSIVKVTAPRARQDSLLESKENETSETEFLIN